MIGIVATSAKCRSVLSDIYPTMPGDNTSMTVELITTIAMDEGQKFAIREGGRTVGAGTVTKIIK